MKKFLNQIKKAVVVIIAVVLIVQLGMIVYHQSGLQAKSRLKHIEQLIDENLSSPRLGMARTHHVAALSFFSEGLLIYSDQFPKEQESVNRIFSKVVRSILNSNSGYPLYNRANYGEENLTLSHVGIILYNYEKATGDATHHSLLSTIVDHLESKLRNSSIASIRSYNRSRSVWPADNSVTYALIYKYRSEFEMEVDTSFYQNWITMIDSIGSDSVGLHIAELTGNEVYSSVPRGCALSWSSAYLTEFNSTEAKRLWKTYKRKMKVSVFTFAGFREYDRGRESVIDGDAGPIILGVGGGATGLSICGAAANNDLLTFYQVNNSMKLIELSSLIASLTDNSEYVSMVDGILPSCIKFYGDMKMVQ